MIPWNAFNESPDYENQAATEDRRRNVRTAPVDDGTALWIEADRRVQVEVVDESAEGIGLIIPADTSFDIGPVVHVDYRGTRRSGTVAHLTSLDDDRYRLGLNWR